MSSPGQPFPVGKSCNEQTLDMLDYSWLGLSPGSLRAASTLTYLNTTSAWTPYTFCSTAFWKDIRVFSGASCQENMKKKAMRDQWHEGSLQSCVSKDAGRRVWRYQGLKMLLFHIYLCPKIPVSSVP